jgi:hypothetical protein
MIKEEFHAIHTMILKSSLKIQTSGENLHPPDSTPFPHHRTPQYTIGHLHTETIITFLGRERTQEGGQAEPATKRGQGLDQDHARGSRWRRQSKDKRVVAIHTCSDICCHCDSRCGRERNGNFLQEALPWTMGRHAMNREGAGGKIPRVWVASAA